LRNAIIHPIRCCADLWSWLLPERWYSPLVVARLVANASPAVRAVRHCGFRGVCVAGLASRPLLRWLGWCFGGTHDDHCRRARALRDGLHAAAEVAHFRFHGHRCGLLSVPVPRHTRAKPRGATSGASDQFLTTLGACDRD